MEEKLQDGFEEETNLQNKIDKVIYYTNLKIQNKKEEKTLINESVDILLKGRQKVHNDFDSKIFRIKKLFHCTVLKTLTPKKALAQVKTGNTSENLLDESRQVIVLCIELKKLVKKYITL